MGLDLQVASEAAALPEAAVMRSWLTAALDGEPDLDVVVRVVDEAESRTLNSRYRGKDTATNVLAFPADTGASDEPLLGDLVICAPLVAREAREQGKPEQAHWAHLLVHGTLHLLGFDHINDADARVMEQREIQILERLGFADPYADTDCKTAHEESDV